MIKALIKKYLNKIMISNCDIAIVLRFLVLPEISQMI